MTFAKNLKKKMAKISRKNKRKKKVSREAVRILLVDPIEKERTKQQIKLLRKYLSNFNLFKTVSSEQIMDVCMLGVAQRYSKNEIIARRNEKLDFLLCIEGQAALLNHTDVPTRLIFPGNHEHVEFFEFPEKSFNRVVVNEIQAMCDNTVILRMSLKWKEEAKFTKLVKSVGLTSESNASCQKNFLSKLPANVLKRVLKKCSLRQYSPRSIIFETTSLNIKRDHSNRKEETPKRRGIADLFIHNSKGVDHNVNNNVLLLIEGAVQVNWLLKDGQDSFYTPVATIGKYEVLGLLEVMYELPISYQVVTDGIVHVLEMPKAALQLIPTNFLREVEKLSFEMWLSWVDHFLRSFRVSKISDVSSAKVCVRLSIISATVICIHKYTTCKFTNLKIYVGSYDCICLIYLLYRPTISYMKI